MNISTGLSEINFLAGAAQNGRKAYIWPVYNSGAVTGIQQIARRNASPSAWISPFSEYPKNRPEEIQHTEYASNGRISACRTSYYPGRFFSALA